MKNVKNNLDKLQDWLLCSAPGRHILNDEKEAMGALISNVFGSYSLQIGLPGIDFLASNKIVNHYVVTHDVYCELNALPFETNSIDLLICPHILEYLPNYEIFLAECYRILAPRGKIIITCFNVKSLFSLFRKKIPIASNINFINLNLLKSHLINVNFNIGTGRFYCYIPPLDGNSAISKLAWLDKVGNRWFPSLANGIMLSATKNIIPVTPITKTKPIFARGFSFGGGLQPSFKEVEK